MNRRLQRCERDIMTPMERIYAYENHLPFDRVICVPFVGDIKSRLCGVSVEKFWKSAEYMVQGEILAYERFGYDRLNIGPNTVGISDALKAKLPVAGREEPRLDDYSQLSKMAAVDAGKDSEIQRFLQVAEQLSEAAFGIVPVEASIGGPFTIASFIRGIEVLLRDCRKYAKEVDQLLRLIVDSQKSCIDALAPFGVGIAMADPVANPGLIGPGLYEKFVFPYTKELTDYAYLKTGKKVSLHMCGNTEKIWKYLEQYTVNEISLDNIVDLKHAAAELGSKVPIAGNVDPVAVMLNGTREEVISAVNHCIKEGMTARMGYHLTTGCDLPDGTSIEKMDWFMDAARKFVP